MDEHFIYIVFCHTSLAVLLIDCITSEQCMGGNTEESEKGEKFGFSKLKDRYIHAFYPELVLGVLLSQKKVHSRECSGHGFSIHYVRRQRLGWFL